MARILLLHQYFPPDSAITGRQGQIIASALAARGHEVSAVVGQPSYEDAQESAPRHEFYEGIDVRRISVGRLRGRRSRAIRFGGYVMFMLGAASAALRRSPDVVLTFHIPPFLPGIALLMRGLRGVRVIYIPQDIHPDILLESGWLQLPPVIHGAWDRFNHLVLSRSDRVVALGEGMRRTLIEKGAAPARTVVIPVWAEPAFAPLEPDDDWRDERGIGREDLLVVYAGNMGLMHPLGPVLGAAAAIRGRGIRIVVAGDGVRRAHWEREVRRRGVDDVLMLPLQRGDDFRRLLAASDVALVALSPGMERLAVPSRPYPSLAAARPVIALTSSEAEIAQDAVRHGAGWHVDDEAGLVALLVQLAKDRAAVTQAGVRARRLYERQYTAEQAALRYAELVDGLVAS